MQTGQQLKQQGISQTVTHNPLTTEVALAEIKLTRECQLRTHAHERVFTVEQIIKDVQTRIRLPIPTSLNGAIGNAARQRGFIENTGRLAEADREIRRCNTVPECRWGLY